MSKIMRPFSLIPVFGDFEKEFNKLLSSGFEPTEISDWQPTADIVEEPNEYVVKVDVPGVDPRDINISLDNNILTIKGERETEHKEKRENFIRYERSKGSFYRRIVLPDMVDGDKVTAKSKNGVLIIIIPKSAKSTSRKIEVQ